MIDTNDRCILTVCLPDAADAADSADVPLWRAKSAREALSILRLAQIDLMFTALHLPDMSPWQLVRRLRASARSPRWALVASDLSPMQEIEARSLGAAAVLERMPEPQTLLAMLASARRDALVIASTTDALHAVRHRAPARAAVALATDQTF